jgi:hypothetical protein
MPWRKMLAYLTGSVDEDLLLRNEYLAAENRILRAKIKGRLLLTDPERATLARIGKRLGRKALEGLSAIVRPDTILAWHRRVVAAKFDGSKTGKTHLAIALGLACVQLDLRVRFATAVELCNLLVEARAQGRLARVLDRLARFDVVVLDELEYVQCDKEGADLLFTFVARLYERRSMVVTTNVPFARWSEVFLDATAAAAVIDRVVHHATVLQTDGASYRLRAAKERPARRRKEGAVS